MHWNGGVATSTTGAGHRDGATAAAATTGDRGALGTAIWLAPWGGRASAAQSESEADK